MKRSVFSLLLVFAIVMLSAIVCAVAATADEAYIDLTSLKPKTATVGWGSLAVNKDLNNGVIDMKSDNGVKTYEKGFVAHAASTLEFDISSLGAQMFTADVGIDRNSANAASNSASVKFKVYVDNVLKYESPVIGYNDAAQSVVVGIPQGARVLKLVADDCGGNTGDHSAWGDPRLYSDGTMLQKMADITVYTDKNVYLTGSSVQVHVDAKNLGGQAMTPNTVTYTVSNDEVASISASGLLTGNKAGLVRVTAVAVDGDVTLEKTIAVSFMDTAEEKNFSISSPSNNVKIDVKLDDQGMVSFKVTGDDGLSLLGDSFIGVNTEFCDFSNALVFVKQIPIETIDETYANISGKKSTVRNHYNQTVLVFEKDVYYFDVYFRAYDDGFAYRFAIRNKDGSSEELKVIEETGTFTLPAKSNAYCEVINNLTSTFCYETGYTGSSVESFSKQTMNYFCYPMLVNIADSDGKKTTKYILLSESDLFSQCYFGTVLYAKGDNVFGMSQAPKVSYGSETIITTQFSSPWRYGIYGEIGDVVESDLTENLAPAPEGDFSWVVPGVTAWMWLSEGYQGQRTEATIKDYVDLAAEMGWKYLILDEGWQPNSSKPGKAYEGYFPYFDSLVSYAAEKGVGFIAWVKYIDLDTPEEREILREWAQIGIKGIKADFFDSEDQKTLEGFKAIYDLCAECHLVVNCHGAGKPTGERRTWPNVINREAVNGEEYGGFWINNAVIWAYTRNVVGPIDITPRLYPTASGNTIGVQLACNIIFESGIPCMASDSEDYRNFNGLSFYKNLPAAWDDTKFVSGTVGDYVTLARRSGDVWYAATITYPQKKNLEMPLSFLGDGQYYAIIYSTKNAKEVNIDVKLVTKDDVLTYNMLRQDGYIVKFLPKSGNAYLPTAIQTAENLQLVSGFGAQIEYTLVGENIEVPDVIFTSADPLIVSVDRTGRLVPKKAGSTTITVESIANPEIKAVIAVKVSPSPIVMNEAFRIPNLSTTSSAISFVLNDYNKIILGTSVGTADMNYSGNELSCALPEGDFTVTVNIDDAPKTEGTAAGVILRAGNAFFAVERLYDGSNKISYRGSSTSKNVTFADTRIGASLEVLRVTIKRTGNTVTISSGYNKTGRVLATVSVEDNESCEVSLYATTPEQSSETFVFSSFTLNDTPVPFAVENGNVNDPIEEKLYTAPFAISKFVAWSILFEV